VFRAIDKELGATLSLILSDAECTSVALPVNLFNSVEDIESF